MGSQERNDENHRPVSDSHYGKLLLEEAHANALEIADIKKPRDEARLETIRFYSDAASKAASNPANGSPLSLASSSSVLH